MVPEMSEESVSILPFVATEIESTIFPLSMLKKRKSQRFTPVMDLKKPGTFVNYLRELPWSVDVTPMWLWRSDMVPMAFHKYIYYVSYKILA